MELTLTDKEATTLGKVLTSYLSDLRMEIANTDRKDYREGLKEEEIFLKRVLIDLMESLA